MNVLNGEMTKPIIALCGEAGSGKDTAARVLVERHGFTAIALAGPLKRFAGEVFGFTVEQLYGPSSARNAPDPRYTREDGTLLTPRAALQRLGTEWGRWCHPTIWLELAIRNARQLLADGDSGVVITDCRFKNEVEGLQAAGAKIVRVRRESRNALTGEAALHPSETEMRQLPDSAFDAVLDNTGTLESLPLRIVATLQVLGCHMDQSHVTSHTITSFSFDAKI